ncbi:MAG: 50S ribosomal protein L25 [Thermodesulfovibrionales bacterium]
MEQITLNAEARELKGKGAARSLRRAGSLPAVLYRGGDSQPIKVDHKEVVSLIKAISGEQVVVNLKFSDGSKAAILKDYQVDPVMGGLLHADFFEVLMTEEVKVTVHITLAGEPVGVKRDKGILQFILREIEVECLPGNIPGHIEVDVSGLEIGGSIHVGDLRVPEGVKVLTDTGEVIATVSAPAVEEAAAAAPEEAVAEAPEVEKKGKEKEKEKEEGEKS